MANITKLENIKANNIEVDSIKATSIDSEITAIKPMVIESTLTLPNSPDNPETAVVTGSYNIRQTANSATTGLTIVDDSITEVQKIKGSTVACHNLVNFEAMKNLALLNNVEIDSDKNTIKILNNAGGGYYIACIGDNNGTAYEKFVKCFGISKAGKYRCTFKSLVNNSTSDWRFNIGANTIFKIGTGNGTVFEVEQADIDAIKNIPMGGNVKLLVYGSTDDVFGEFQISEGEEAKPYVPYYTGLKNANFKGIESIGKNLLKQKGRTVATLDGGVTSTKRTIELDKVYRSVNFANNSAYTATVIINDDNNSISFNSARPVSYGIGLPFRIFPGYTYKFSATYNNSIFGGVAFYDKDGNFLYGHPHSASNSVTVTNKKVYYAMFCITTTSSDMVTVSDIQVERGNVESEYAPYVESEISLNSAIELPLGKYIDVENKKLIDKGYDLTFTGKESWGTYYYNGMWGVSIPNLSPIGADTVPDYVSTDSVKAGNGFGLGSMWCGYGGTKNFFWIGILDILGYTADFVDKVNATEDEKKQALTQFRSYITQRYENGNPVKVRYITQAIQSEEPILLENTYNVQHNGTEQIIQGAVDNSIYNAILTTTQKYSIHENPKEAASKAYVNNGLAKKLDKTGGTITGHLVVENGTNTTLPALVVTNNEHTYGLALEDDTYKLGEGSIDTENKFTFNDGEGLPVALRDDSSAFADGELVKWSADGNKLSAAGINVAKLGDISRLNALIDGLTDAQIAALNNFAKTLS